MRMKENDFNEIYKRNYRRSFLFVKSYVHDDMAAEDIVAESLVKYWRAVSSGNNKPVNESLLLTMLRNRALDFLRHQAVHEAAVGEMANLNDRELSIRISTLAACDPEEIFSKEIQAIIHEALRSLPEQTRRVFIMSRFENKSVKDIAEERTVILSTHILTEVQAICDNIMMIEEGHLVFMGTVEDFMDTQVS